jgi:hypothetical protein
MRLCRLQLTHVRAFRSYYAPGKARLSKTEKIQLAAMYPKKGGRGKGDKKSKACVIL